MRRQAVATGKPYHTEALVRRADRAYRWHAIDGVAAREENGKVIKWYGTAYDIEDRKRAEDALRQSEHKFHRIIDMVPSLLCSADPTGEPTYVNQLALDYSGMRFEEFKHGGWEAFIHPADLPEAIKAFSHAIDTGPSYETVHRCVGGTVNIAGTKLAAIPCAIGM